MPRLRLQIAYHGAAYHGWQIQPSVSTVEGALTDAIARLLNVDAQTIKLQGASRTDAGVHAFGQTAHLDHDSDRSLWDFTRGLNALTPDDITVTRVEEVSPEFHARHSARGKIYGYRIWNHRFIHPMLQDRAWNMRQRLDLDAMREACSRLIGAHDFAAFRAMDCQAETTIRELTRVAIEQDGAELMLWVEGTAFLKYMVRVITGTLVKIGVGRAKPELIDELFLSGDRRKAGQTAPPQGLTLYKIHYPEFPWGDPEPSLGSAPLAAKDQTHPID